MDRRVKRRSSRTDVMAPAQRRKAMQANRGRTRLEKRVASSLWREGLRYLTADGYRARTGQRFPGSPDMIFSGRRCVLFVDGCFWHGCHRCHDFKCDLDASWLAKIERNVARDRRIRRDLRRDGWTVLVVREHELSTIVGFDRAIRRLTSRIDGNRYHPSDARRRRPAQG
jgi:DNA mismatch endonuclease (patch repair protein)